MSRPSELTIVVALVILSCLISALLMLWSHR